MAGNFNCEDSKIELFQCTKCEFATELTVVIKQHTRICQKCESHNVKKEYVTAVYICENCDFATSFLLKWYKHVLDNCISVGREIKWFKCDKCEYKSKWKRNLGRHVSAKHNKICGYGKNNFSKDSAVTKNKLFECSKCEYKSKWKRCLEEHIVNKHIIIWLKCGQCSFKTKNKQVLLSHTKGCQVFKENKSKSKTTKKPNPEERLFKRETVAVNVQWLKCGQCEFKTDNKSEFRNHRKFCQRWYKKN